MPGAVGCRSTAPGDRLQNLGQCFGQEHSVCGAPALPTEPQVKFRFIYIAHLKKNKQTEKSKTTCRPKYAVFLLGYEHVEAQIHHLTLKMTNKILKSILK